MLNILLLFIFIRPLISSLAFPYLNAIFSAFFLAFLSLWVIRIFYQRDNLNLLIFLKWPIGLFFLSLVISTGFCSNKVKASAELYKYASGIFLLILAASLNAKGKMSVIKTLVITGLIISLFAAYQYFFGFPHLINYMARERVADSFAIDYVLRARAFSPFITPNTLAGYIIMIMPLALIFKRSPWLIIPLAFSLILTKSLGALLSLLLALILFFSLQPKINKKKIILLLAIPVIISLIFWGRSHIPHHLQPSASTMMRINYWQDTLRIIKLSPLTGVGIGNFNLTQSRFAHNSYLQIWAETGILGIISFIWLFFLILSQSVKNLKNPREQNQIKAGVISAAAAFLLHNLIDFSFFLPEVALTWWLILGLNINIKTASKA